jgi:hypothetical protein
VTADAFKGPDERGEIFYSDLLAICRQELHTLDAFEREAYPSVHELYSELRRPTPRRKEPTP